MDLSITIPTLAQLRTLVKEGSVKFVVLFSLALQVLLLLLGTLRKRTSGIVVKSSVFLVYKLSSKVATIAFLFIVGAKSLSLAQLPFGLWAAFMLLHVAGQERLTAYSLKDFKDRAWRSFLTGMAMRYGVHFWAGFHRGDRLSVMTVSIFLLAVIRLFARTLRLLLALWEVDREVTCQAPLLFSLENEHEQSPFSSSDDLLQSVLNARCLLKSSLRLIANILPDNRRFLKTVEECFSDKMDPPQAIRIVEAELNLIYDSFYTDGIIRRYLNSTTYLIYLFLNCYALFFCAFTVSSAFNSLCTRETLSEHCGVTWFLLGGTVILEVLAFLATVFSFWTIASSRHDVGSILLSLALRSPGRRAHPPWLSHVPRVMVRQWSEVIPKFNYLAYGFRQQSGGKLKDYFKLLALTGEFSERYSDDLGIFIFKKLQEIRNERLSKASDSKKFSLSTKMWLEDISVEVFRLHIATEVLYRNYDVDPQQQKICKYSKLLSEYMAYLLHTKSHYFKLKPGDDAWDEVQNALASMKDTASGNDSDDCVKKFCQIISTLEQPEGCSCDWTDVKKVITDVIQEGDSKALNVEWDVIGKKWVELLLHVGFGCDPIEHVREVCEGGQLVSLVWLLGSHLGFRSS